MKDLTEGPITRHLLRLAAPIGIGMLFQTLYHLVDLYFVAKLGEDAIAGVGAAGNLQFIVMALTQVLGAGTMALIAHAVGRRDREDAVLVFNQSLVFAALCATATLVLGYGLRGRYMSALAADAAARQAGIDYLTWFLPGLALQFALVAMGSALRGSGIAKPTMIVQMLTVVLNAILSPILIAGWLTGRPLGVAGAGLATSLSIAVGVVVLWREFRKNDGWIRFSASELKPRLPVWRRLLVIGLPPGGEFALMFVNLVVIYWILRHFGSAAQAGFSVGSRVMQAVFLPAMAIAFAAAPLAGQNFGAGHYARVRASFRTAALIGSAIMFGLTLFCQWQPTALVRPFTDQAHVIEISTQFLNIISWNFVASGLIFTVSGLFQALGNTLPAFFAGATRLVTFALPAILLSSRPGFELRHLWYLSVVTTALHMLVGLYLLRRELRRRLVDALPEAA